MPCSPITIPGPATVQGGEDEQFTEHCQPVVSLWKCVSQAPEVHEELELTEDEELENDELDEDELENEDEQLEEEDENAESQELQLEEKLLEHELELEDEVKTSSTSTSEI